MALTPQEKFALRNYREIKGLCSHGPTVLYLTIILTAAVCTWRYFSTGEQAWMLTAVGILGGNVLLSLYAHLTQRRAAIRMLEENAHKIASLEARAKEDGSRA
jgi:hypothetical protein